MFCSYIAGNIYPNKLSYYSCICTFNTQYILSLKTQNPFQSVPPATIPTIQTTIKKLNPQVIMLHRVLLGPTGTRSYWDPVLLGPGLINPVVSRLAAQEKGQCQQTSVLLKDKTQCQRS